MKSSLLALLAVILICPLGLAANIRASHLAPRAPTVDVYLNGVKTFTNLPFRTVTDYLSVPDGDYNITVYAAGQTSNPILEARDVMLEGGNFTITAAGFGPTKSLNPVVLRDDLSPLPDRPKLRLVNAAPDYPALSLSTPAGTDVLPGTGFKSATPYFGILPLLQDFDVRSGGLSLLRLRELDLRPGRVYTVFVVGSTSDGTLNYVLTEDKL
jgi:Domain of unknown function (DUF4397)